MARFRVDLTNVFRKLDQRKLFHPHASHYNAVQEGDGWYAYVEAQAPDEALRYVLHRPRCWREANQAYDILTPPDLPSNDYVTLADGPHGAPVQHTEFVAADRFFVSIAEALRQYPGMEVPFSSKKPEPGDRFLHGDL